MPEALRCPACNAPLSIPEGRAQFYCQYCGTPVVIPVDGDPVSDDPRREQEAVLEKAVGIPEKLRIEDLGHELILSWSWYNHSIWFLAPFCIGWNAFLIGWYVSVLSLDGPPAGLRLIMLVFPVAHVAVGVGLLYLCLGMLFNRTQVRVCAGELSVSHVPLPAPGARSLAADQIERLHISHDRKSPGGRLAHVYTLLARLKTGRDVQLLPQSTELELARAVEHLVEQRLGIRDDAD